MKEIKSRRVSSGERPFVPKKAQNVPRIFSR